MLLLSAIYHKFVKNAVIYPPLSISKNPFYLLNNKQVVISGGSSGIGKSLKDKLSNCHCNIVDFSKSTGLILQITIKLMNILKIILIKLIY